MYLWKLAPFLDEEGGIAHRRRLSSFEAAIAMFLAASLSFGITVSAGEFSQLPVSFGGQWTVLLQPTSVTGSS